MTLICNLFSQKREEDNVQEIPVSGIARYGAVPPLMSRPCSRHLAATRHTTGSTTLRHSTQYYLFELIKCNTVRVVQFLGGRASLLVMFCWNFTLLMFDCSFISRSLLT